MSKPVYTTYNFSVGGTRRDNQEYIIMAPRSIGVHTPNTFSGYETKGIGQFIQGGNMAQEILRLVRAMKNTSLEEIRLLDREEAVGLLMFSRMYQGAFEGNGDTPEWLVEQVQTLERHVKQVQKDELARQLKVAQSTLSTAKRKKDPEGYAQAEVDRLKAALEASGA